MSRQTARDEMPKIQGTPLPGLTTPGLSIPARRAPDLHMWAGVRTAPAPLGPMAWHTLTARHRSTALAQAPACTTPDAAPATAPAHEPPHRSGFGEAADLIPGGGPHDNGDAMRADDELVGNRLECPDVLVIEDTPSLRLIYEQQLRAMGLRVISAETAGEGRRLFAQSAPPIVLLDLLLPDHDGLDILRDMLRIRPDTAIIVITADRSVDRAVTAMRGGARDFLVKPVSEARLSSVVQNARRSVLVARADDATAAEPLPGFIGNSPAMQLVYDRIRSAARSTAPVFITGETGTGKELCAEAIHALSARSADPFVILDCSSLGLDRFDTEVFGHVRGAIPGAVADMPGALQRADGGTLVLDKIDELDLQLQGKLMRVLQSGSFLPLGGSEARRCDLRLISTALRPPQEAVAEGKLREDLFYRLSVVPIHMPALRERPEDVAPIADTLLRRHARQENRAFRWISPQAHAILESQDWPGNVRQLTNVLRSVTVLHDAEELVPAMLPSDLPLQASPLRNGAMPEGEGMPWAGQTLHEIERRVIEAALTRHGESVPQAARELDVAPSTLYRKLEQWRKRDA